ncbi:MAG: nucleoside triphosphate pyrophosphohydrolase [Alphaproteobacteria bacterium]
MKQNIENLIDIMALLRTPEKGCPWDIKQSFDTIAPYTIEEAYEVYDAIEKNDMAALKDELGDLLLQVVYHSRMAEEQNIFSFNDVAAIICEKMIRRHPHVFGESDKKDWHEKPMASWETQKAKERQKQKTLDGVALALPALMRAIKLQARAARVGFDWPDVKQVFDKIKEEILELEVEIENNNQINIVDEMGDLLFALANLARKLNVDAEQALRKTNQKFINRFEYIEKKLAEKGQKPEDATLDEMEAYWQEAKKYT